MLYECVCAQPATHTSVEAQGHHGYLPSCFPSYLLRQRLSLNLELTFGTQHWDHPPGILLRLWGKPTQVLKPAGRALYAGATFPAPRVKPHEKVVWTGKSFLKETSQAGLRVETKKTAKKWDLEAYNCQYLCNSFTGNSVPRILLHLAFFCKYICPCHILHWLLSYSTLLVPQTWCILGTLYTALFHLTSIHICLCHTYPLVTAQMWMPERHDTQDKLKAIRTLVTVTFHFSSWCALS